MAGWSCAAAVPAVAASIASPVIKSRRDNEPRSKRFTRFSMIVTIGSPEGEMSRGILYHNFISLRIAAARDVHVHHEALHAAKTKKSHARLTAAKDKGLEGTGSIEPTAVPSNPGSYLKLLLKDQLKSKLNLPVASWQRSGITDC
jgi:hypothetical protein